MKKAIDVSPKHLVLIQTILWQCLPHSAQVWVFGSRAKQTAKKFSDIDLAIDLGRPLTLAESAQLADAFEESTLPYKVDIVDWQTISPDFKAVIQDDRINLPFQLAQPGSHVD